MAHVYSHLYKLPTTGLRFFTVYGPWGRPDMSPFIFAKSIIEGTVIKLFNNGNHQRDFTYIDDIVAGILAVLNHKPESREVNGAPYKIYNIGNSFPVPLLDYLGVLEEKIGKRAVTEMAPLQPGDVEATYADVSDLMSDTGFSPRTSLNEGIDKFVAWYKEYYGT
jgi:UDP-glucuronate 4-epimerase